MKNTNDSSEETELSAIQKLKIEGDNALLKGKNSTNKTIRRYYKHPVIKHLVDGDEELDIIIPYEIASLSTLSRKRGPNFTPLKKRRKKRNNRNRCNGKRK